ncbi:MAG: TolC family protein, partial [Cellvibrionaceae bacterium]|nr:TolC family protein [Cellvibrionaceae bacterium]
DKARRKQTSYLMEEAKDVRNNTRRQVVEGLQLSWTAYESVSAQLEFLQKHVQAAQATKEAYVEQFNIGRRTLLDLLNTENEVVDAQRSLIRAVNDQKLAELRIYNSMGMLLPKLGL